MTMLTVNRKAQGVPSIFNVIDDVFASTLPFRPATFKGSFVPSVNVHEDEQGFHLEVLVPGYEKQDFAVAVEKDTLKITGKHEAKAETKEKNYTRKEFSFGSFERNFTLPENVVTEGIDAQYTNGILHISIPKKTVAAETTKKQIEIK